jgi:hypothetical protein
MTMNRTVKTAVLILLGLGVFLAGCGQQEKPAEQAASDTEKPAVSRVSEVSITATVEAVDQQERTLTLRDEDGDMINLRVSDQITDFSKIDVGDMVKVTYYESFVASVLSPEEQAPENEDKTVALDPQGEKKGVATLGVTQRTVTVEGIDLENRMISVKNDKGEISDLPVREDVRNLENLKVGDKIVIRVTQAMAIGVQELED